MGQASDFFGIDFGAERQAPTPQSPQPKEPSLVEKALDFFGIDFRTPAPKQMPAPVQAPAPKQDQFETVFNNMIQAESKGQHTDSSGSLIRSSVGAEGITQLMPATAQDPGYGIEGVKDKSKGEYMRVGREYLKAMLKEFDGDYEKALAAYNAGVGNVKKAITKAEQKGGEWINYLPKKSETVPYIQKVLGKEKTMNSGAEDDGVSTQRASFEEFPKYKATDIVNSGLDTLKARNAWVDKMEAEYKKAIKGKSAAERDKMWSNSWFYAKDKHPKDAVAYMYFDNQKIDGLPAEARSFLEKYNPDVSYTSALYNAKGWVYADKGDRVFLGGDGDANTFVHEAEHMRQQADFAKMKLDAPHAQVGMIGNSHTPIAQLKSWTLENRDDPAVKEVWRAGNAHKNSDEWLANLQAFWKTGIPEGKSWSDTKFYKKLEKDVGKEKALTMMLDALGTLQRADYSIGRISK